MTKRDRKSTRLNSSHGYISYAVFCLKKKKTLFCHFRNSWLAPLPRQTDHSRRTTTSTTSIEFMGLQAAYANLHTDQERDYFMQRYHDVICSFGGKTSYDADNRRLLVMRSNLSASGYDVNGTFFFFIDPFPASIYPLPQHAVLPI